MWTAEKRNNSAIHLGYPSNAAQLISDRMVKLLPSISLSVIIKQVSRTR